MRKEWLILIIILCQWICIGTSPISSSSHSYAVTISSDHRQTVLEYIVSVLGGTVFMIHGDVDIIQMNDRDVQYYETLFSLNGHIHHHEHLPSSDIVKKDTVNVNKRAYPYNDPQGDTQWHFDFLEIDSVLWNQFNGNGVLVQIIDDGIDFEHLDLIGRQDNISSWSFLSENNVVFPIDQKFVHGTGSAGLVSAIKDNGICGCGVAFGARIAGVKMLDLDTLNDAIFVEALTGHTESVDISLNTWGHPDTGLLYSTTKLYKDALKHSTQVTRDGKGISYIWSSGNGGYGDNCNYDELVHGPYIITVTGVTSESTKPYYTEHCTANFISSPTGGGSMNLITTSVDNSCIDTYTGTSGAASIASAVVALCLDANPSLTYRDIMYILQQSATINAEEEDHWVTNGAGIMHSDVFGFGILNARVAISLSKYWKSVGDLNIETLFVTPQSSISDLTVNEFHLFSDSFGKLEHITVTIDMEHDYYFDIDISLTSPSGVVSKLLPSRDAQINFFQETNYMGTSYLKHVEGTPFIDNSFTSKNKLIYLKSNNFCSDIVLNDGSDIIFPLQANTIIIWDEYYSPLGCHQIIVDVLIKNGASVVVLWINDFANINSSLPVYSNFINDQLMYDMSFVGARANFNKMDVYDFSTRSMTTVKHWGENTFGEWIVTVKDTSPRNEGILNNITLNFYTENGCKESLDHLIVFGYCKLQILKVSSITIQSTGRLNFGTLHEISLLYLEIEQGGMIEVRSADDQRTSLKISSHMIFMDGLIILDGGELRIESLILKGEMKINNPQGDVIIDSHSMHLNNFQIIALNTFINCDNIVWKGEIMTEVLILESKPLFTSIYHTEKTINGAKVSPLEILLTVKLIGDAKKNMLDQTDSEGDSSLAVIVILLVIFVVLVVMFNIVLYIFTQIKKQQNLTDGHPKRTEAHSSDSIV